MAKRPTVRLSSDSLGAEGLAKDQGQAGGSNTCGSQVAQTAMFPRMDKTVLCSQVDITIVSGSVNTGTSDTSQASNVPLSSLEVERQALSPFGYSKGVMNTLLASRRKSTKRVYNRTWKKFSYWCRAKGVQETKPKSEIFLSFYSRGCKKG